MFTGIVEGTGRLVEKRKAGGGQVFAIEAGFDLTEPCEGESIAVNGVCLTAYRIKGRRFLADVSPESLARTMLGGLAAGDLVNLERALKVSGRLGGHIVSGHVDCVAAVTGKRPMGNFTIFSFSLPMDFFRYVVEKGSIAINGVSLTVNECSGGSFSVSIIPHTLQETSLGGLEIGSQVNIEVDIIGKYVEKLLSGAGKKTDVSMNLLAENGFL
ncbi:MAG: riboflavin synthase [Deltaproteobacteria bacterium]|nr:MAG: riboflavin synthase [Deltaproteobacteria bacterium]